MMELEVRERRRERQRDRGTKKQRDQETATETEISKCYAAEFEFRQNPQEKGHRWFLKAGKKQESRFFLR